MFAIIPSGRRAIRLCAALAALAVSMAPAVAQQRIGINSAVNPDVRGNPPPGASMRRLVIGQEVVYNEHLVTGAAGQTQILFLDESAMTIGPNADMVVDQFVYNPQAGTGRLLASLTKGVFRFVGGRLSKQPNAVEIKTPAATIGIRGGVFLADLTPQGRLDVIFIFGRGLTVTANGVTSTISRPGYEVLVPSLGSVPSAPFAVPSGLTSRLLAQLDGRAGGNGGAATVPTDATVADSGIAGDISDNPNALVVAEQLPPPPPSENPNPETPSSGGEVQEVSSQTQPFVVSSSQGQPPGPIAPPGTPISGSFYSTGSGGTETGFDLPGTPYSGRFNDGAIVTSFGSFPSTFVSPDGTFAFADIEKSGQSQFIYGGQAVNPSFYTATTSAPRFYAFNVGADAALESGIPFIRNVTGGNMVDAAVSKLYMAIPANNPFAGPLSGGVVAKTLQASLAINGTGASQSSVIVIMVGNPLATSPEPTLVGQVAGSYLANGTSQPVAINSTLTSATDSSGVSFYGNNQISGFVVTGSPTETVFPTGSTNSYNFVEPVTATTLPSGVGSSVSSRTLTGFMGGIMTEENAAGGPLAYALTGSASITTDASTFRIGANFTGSDPFTSSASGIISMLLQYGNLGAGTGAAQAFIDDNLFAALEDPVQPSMVDGNFANADTYMVSAAVFPSSASLPPGNALCSCQYLEWGAWGGELDSPSPDGTVRVDYGHINTWVAGVPTSSTDLSNLQSLGAKASYAGNAVGTVFNNGAQYLAVGAYSGNYNFGTQTGAMTISNFDGHTFGGTIAGSGGTYSANLSGSGLQGIANGIFFGPGAIETGGNFAVQGLGSLPYYASGIFGGRQTGS